MSANAAQPVFAGAPGQYLYSSPATYAAPQGGVPMEPVAGAIPGQPAQTVTYQTVAAGSIAAQPSVIYAAPQATAGSLTYVQPVQPQEFGTAGAVTYVQAQPQEAGFAGAVTYAAPQVIQSPAPVTYTMPQEAGAVTYAAPQVMQAPAPIAYTLPQGATTYSAGFPSAPSMVAYPGSVTTPYFPVNVQQAWDNHAAAFRARDVEKIMLDYDETSIVRVYSNIDAQLAEYYGTARIREFFTGVFQELSDMSTFEAPVTALEEDYKQVFLVFKVRGCGLEFASDTFIFGPDHKIKRQNVTLVKKAGAGFVPQTVSAGAAAVGAAVGATAGAAGAAVAGAAAQAPSSAKAEKKSSKKGSKKKLGSKKKAKSGFC